MRPAGVTNAARTALAGAPCSQTVEIGGRIFQITFVPKPRTGAEPAGLIGVAHDITELHNRTIELSESEARLQESEAGSARWSPTCATSSSAAASAAKARTATTSCGAALYGADAPRLAGTVDEHGRARIGVWYDAVHPDDRPAYLAAERRRKEGLEPYALEYRITHPATGELRWMREVAWVVEDQRARLTYFDSYIHDITEPKRVGAGAARERGAPPAPARGGPCRDPEPGRRLLRLRQPAGRAAARRPPRPTCSAAPSIRFCGGPTETATVEEIEDVYLQSWKLGLKATAIYRDNCKVGQPLSDRQVGLRQEDQGLPTSVDAAVEIVEKFVYAPTRGDLPKSRTSRTTSFTFGGAEATSPRAPRRRQLGEVFLSSASRAPPSPASSTPSRSRSPSAPVRRPPRDLRLEVHQPLLRARRSHRTTPTSGWRSRSSTTSSAGSPSTTSTSRPARASASSPPDERQRYLETGSYELPLEAFALPGSRRRPVRSLPLDTARPLRGRRRRGRRRPRTPTAPTSAQVPADPPSGPHEHRAPRADHRTAVDPPLHDLRHQDAPRRLLLRLEGCGSTSGCS